MLQKNAKYRVKNAQGVYEVVHLETNANQVIETQEKQFVSANEKAEWTGKATVESVTNVQNNVDKVVEDLASEVSRATGAEQGLNERISTLEGLVVGGEGEGLSAVIEDVAKNKADIVDLQAGLSDEISARESADALINGEISKNKTDITKLQEDLASEVANRESANALINENLGKKANISDLEAEITRATGVEQGLDARLSNVETKANTNETNIGKNAQAIEKEVVDRQVDIARVEGLVSAERERAEGVEKTLQTAIDKKATKEELTAEQTRVNDELDKKATKEEFVAEQEKVEGQFEQIQSTLEGHSELIDTATALAQENKEKKADKTQVATDIATGVAQAKGYADEKLVEAKAYADGKLVEGKEYTDEEITKVNATVNALDTAYKLADAQVLADAKAHANKAVADLVDNAPEALNTLKELADALTSHENEYDALLETVGKKANAEDVYTKAEVEGIKSGLKTDIAKVESDYKSADLALNGRLTAVEDITSGVGAIRSELNKAKEDIVVNANEIEGCKQSIEANATAITKEAQDRNKADLELDGKITAERQRAEGVEANLGGRLATVESDLGKAKGDIIANADAIAQETANREEAVNTINAKINQMMPVTGTVQPVDRLEGHIWIEIL